MIILGIGLAVIVLIIVYIVIESSGFRTVTYTLESEKIPRDIKITLLADLHNKDFGKGNAKLLDEINAFSPDLVCFAGDMVTSGWSVSFDYQGTLSFLQKIAEQYPVCYGLGNHEQNFKEDREKFPHDFDDLKQAVTAMGIDFLDNTHVSFDELSATVYGLNLEYAYYRRGRQKQLSTQKIEELLGRADPEKFTILLAHNPAYFETYAKWQPDLVLAGHVHGGIVRLPFLGGVISPGLKLFPKYDYGLFRSENTTMIISCGIGSHSIPVRINNKAELVNISIKASRKM